MEYSQELWVSIHSIRIDKTKYKRKIMEYTSSTVAKEYSAYDSFSEKISFTTQPKEYTSAGAFATPSLITSGAIL